ncbi:Phospholipase/carboxyhydrolase [Plasmopara halstedii]|uniref:Phospholipase/carboxyhydrolase n=1 Tax=Plasmopara halstedii TaxID=4781 RepID=A0A0P1B4V5_PLAHL|nr:Phospholipase/carboxyhydrolase [Plasmopara halstedii]CEG49850.1 Phospholipase/carboxyhydrolase [Plasmopara halstedii]|eukprot:XP_024586219.1 Phospholipase/carboxyhydrolase [Plasmopara halstedii]
MEHQTRGLRKALGPNADFFYFNGPFEARGQSDEAIERAFGSTAPFYEWWNTRSLENFELDDIQGEGFREGTTSHWRYEYEDITQAIEYVNHKLNELGEFDMAVGFSQGSTMLTILSMWYHKHSTNRWWKLLLNVCGVYPGGVNVRELFETQEGHPIMVPLPSIHVVGQKDCLYKDSLLLKDMFIEHPKGSSITRLLLEHDGGHKFPTYSRHKDLYANLAKAIWQFFDDTCQSNFARL